MKSLSDQLKKFVCVLFFFGAVIGVGKDVIIRDVFKVDWIKQ